MAYCGMSMICASIYNSFNLKASQHTIWVFGTKKTYTPTYNCRGDNIKVVRFGACNIDVFSMKKAEEGKETYPEIAAIVATLIEHQHTERAAHIMQRGKRDTSNWKWVGRWERMQK